MTIKNDHIDVIGAGLAGCEAAYQLTKRGVHVKLYDMKPGKMSPAHRYPGFGELVCSNSLGSNARDTAGGLLKAEMRLLDSLIIRAADATAVPAGSALAVDRTAFSDFITGTLRADKNIEIVPAEVTDLPKDTIAIVATGPLTSDALARKIERATGQENLYFYDAASPIVTLESLDLNRMFYASRYGNGRDYLNSPMNREEYTAFYENLVNADTVILKDFEKRDIFEGCMPIEIMAKRGVDTIRYGPLRPKGLAWPEPYAVAQLRRENEAGTLFNLVGFQTNLTFREQKRVFSMLPGLEHADFVRCGVMHRNTFINAPKTLDPVLRLKHQKNICFAGQVTGVEGYVESASSGLIAGLFAYCMLNSLPFPKFGRKTAVGALLNHVTGALTENFQPMNANFGIIEPLREKIRDKKMRKLAISKRALQYIKNTADMRLEGIDDTGNDDCSR